MQALNCRSYDRHKCIQLDGINIITDVENYMYDCVFCTTYKLCKKCKDICLDNKPAVIKCTSLED